VSDPPEVRVRRASKRRRADEWALVLLAEGLHPRLQEEGRSFDVLVPLDEADVATRVLHEYDQEETEEAPPAVQVDLRAGAGVGLGLVFFFLAIGGARPPPGWLEQGAADAERILAGELWRTVTALTLHADLRHVGANALSGAFLLAAACGLLGRGVALLLVLLAGALGNGLNALVYGEDHVSIGASTAVFGALGLLVGIAVRGRHRRRIRGRRVWAPLGAGLALLAFVGMGEGRVDVWAHLWGFVAGAGLALGVAFTAADELAASWQRAFVGAAALIVLGCWLLALA
jgi:membrane associated rhomboid family serine protease